MSIYWKLFKVKIKEVIEYRVSFINDTLIQLFAYMVTFINITLLLNQIDSLDGWTYKEILLLWILNVISYGFAGMFVYSGCKQLETHIQHGTFDYYLTKPLSSFWYYMMKNINTTFIFHICFSALVLIWILNSMNAISSMNKLFEIVILIACAICIQSCIMIIFAIPSFWIVKSSDLVNTAIYGFRNFNTYPMSIYSKCIRGLLTFTIPYAFVSYYPAMYILDKKIGIIGNHIVITELSVTTTIVLVATMLWKVGIKKYSSTGN